MNKGVIDVTIKDGVEKIYNNAFALCDSLKTIYLPDSITQIQDNAFYPGIVTLTMNCYSYGAEWASAHYQKCELIHAWDEPVYSWSEDYTQISAIRTCLSISDHEETETVGTIAIVVEEPTCEGKGKTLYTSKAFINSGFITQSITLEDIEPLGHEWIIAYTWSDDYKSITAKRICGNDSEHFESETVSVTSEVIMEPTCMQDGITRYTSEDFQNEAFIKQSIELADLPKTGHLWGEAVYVWSDDHLQVTAEHVCLNNIEHTETETVEATKVVSREPTCTKEGETTYTSNAFENAAFSVQIIKLDDIDKSGHDWGETVYRWSEDYAEVTGERICQNDDTHIQTETAKTVSAEHIESTCTEAGGILYNSDTFINDDFDAQSIFVIDPNDPAKGHAIVIIEALDPTCEEEGRTEGSYCERCEEILLESEPISALGHDWEEPIYIWHGGERKMTAKRICTNDNLHIETETVNMVAVIKSPTEASKGSYYYLTENFINPAFTAQQKFGEIPSLNELKPVHLSEQLIEIDEDAFENTTFKSIIIPESCETIGNNAFKNCMNLVYVRIPSSIKNVAVDAFEGCPDVIIDMY